MSGMSEDRSSMIRERLTRELDPVELEIVDESAKHAGHAGAASGGGHFIVHIVANAFEGKNLIQRHRMVYDAMDELMQSEIHALSIQAKTPQEV
ncbi:MAG: BolA/IbaG family iron-sulfur metabolism protein [Gammaproteobacteria bacterium]|jgi:BolA protein|nr:BolA/IbaG family iron-sulfur metabolism protein [Gammaproteobacteria bacterium]